MLYRRFPLVPGAALSEPGGPLFVPILDQGDGRHDNPDAYGALYLSRSPVSPVAEMLVRLRNVALRPDHLLSEGFPYALAAFDEADVSLLDLDDPANLVARELRPSGVATRQRDETRPVALRLYEEGHAGFEWWSTIEASWINVTVFAERAASRLTLAGTPEPLTLDHPVVREAADAVGVLVGG
ncbi:MAG TPA: RES domain-containing protein [Actinomycetota bacterium]|nr:RES domain-containing protein [Actinomycetota bacterium]